MAHPLSRTGVRLGLVAVAVAVIALGIGAFVLGAPETTRSLGRSLAIAVVSPVEPEIEPGAAMEVGALNDGFDRTALERGVAPPIDDTLPPPAWVGDETLADDPPRMPMPTPVHDTPSGEVSSPSAVSTDPLADGSRVFGFDRPRPDYAAERARRWNKPEAAADENVGPVQYSPE